MADWIRLGRLTGQVAAAKMIMLAVWAIWMVYRISSSGSLLGNLPYVPTRFQQLAHRFFSVQVRCDEDPGGVHTPHAHDIGLESRRRQLVRER